METNKHNFVYNFMVGGINGGISKICVALFERLLNKEFDYTLVRVNSLHYFQTQALNFSFFGIYRSIFPDNFGGLVFAGGLAGITSLLPVYPLYYSRVAFANAMVEARKQDKQVEYSSSYDALRKLPQRIGIFGLYKGIGISLPGVFVYRGIYFGTYCYFKSKMGKKADYYLPNLALAWGTTVLAAFASFPFDHVRRVALSKEYKTSSYSYIVKHEFQNQGIKGFYKGASVHFLRAFPGALTLALYDMISK